MNYMVVLFKNKVRKKIINKFVTLDKAEEFFNKKIDENKEVYFDRRVENARDCSFTLCLLERKNDQFNSLFVRDQLGRQVKVELDDPEFKIMKVSDFKVEETIFDITSKEKITLKEFYNKNINNECLVYVSNFMKKFQ